MIESVFFFAVAVPAVLLAGISKGGFGGGLGIVAVPLMALAVPVPVAAAIMLPILCLMDLLNLGAYWGKWDRRNLALLLPASMAGIALGALTFRYVDEASLRLIIGTIAVGFTLNHWLKGRKAAPRAATRLAGGFWGGVAGFTSFAAHAGGPPINVFLLPQRLDKTVYQATTVVFFTAVNYVKLLPYWWLGQLNAPNLTTSAVLAPLAFLGIWAGVRLHRAVPEGPFYRIAYALVFVTGLKLLYDGITGLA
ncbi:sulfite exporter TauE/SafE family protein [Futiania mangrovi]|uniref:Probable membrane transporter protein n=1 Tax=Futiania mangrovi TaxID=2959716 RepID=A0A9J6PC99_9PROT|nr:sulfite exporter TauE/SafE family protein [Futiania mangrovii]MCP1336177.1 sulfite exporter TauE/SafE family protein [Futiania mangrovii]